METKKDFSANFDKEQLLLNCLRGVATDNEFEEAWKWINKSADNYQFFEQIRYEWLALSINQSVDKFQIEKRWEHLSQKIEKRTSETPPVNDLNEKTGIRKMAIKVMKIAAVLIITFILGGLGTQLILNHKDINQSSDFFTIEAPRGSKSFLTLSDGTKVWLNAGSKIKYFKNYNQQNRDIYLQGEAFFTVAKNKKIPFLVHAFGIVVKAVGTSFNVKAYPDGRGVETTLVEGIVNIESTGKGGRKETIVLKSNQKALFNSSDKTLIVKSVIETQEGESEAEKIEAKPGKIVVSDNVKTEVYTSWKDKRWVFQKETLENIAVRLERLYDVHVIFRDDELKEFNLSGAFQEETLEQVLDAIRLTIPIDYTIKHQEVIISMDSKLKNKYQKLLINN